MKTRLLLCLFVGLLVLSTFAFAAERYTRQCGPGPGFTAVIPTNWTLKPAGKQLRVGEMPYGCAVSPDGRLVAVSNDGQGEQSVMLVEASAWKVLHKWVFKRPLGVYWGLVFSPDSKRLYAAGGGCNRIFVLDCVHYTAPLEVPMSTSPSELVSPVENPENFAAGRLPEAKKGLYPAGLALSPGGRFLYVTNVLQGTLAVVDTHKLQVIRRLLVGGYPYAVALSPDGALLCITRWADKALLVLDRRTFKQLASLEVGSHPCAVAFNPVRPEAYVANSSSDTVSVIDTRALRIKGEIDLHPYPGAPAGSSPQGLAVSPDGSRLFIANAGNNDVAVVDLSQPSPKGAYPVVGLIPTAWYPADLALSPDGRTLYTLSAKGLGSGPNAYPRRTYIPRLLFGLLAKVKVPGEATLARYTRRVIEYNGFDERASVRRPQKRLPKVIPLRPGDPSPIKYVYYFIKENRTYDQVLGDDPRGNGDPKLVLFGKKVSPNHHKIAETWVLLDNFYVDSTVSVDGHQWCKAANVTDAMEKTWEASYSKRGPLLAGPLAAPDAGYIWDACKRYDVSCKVYGSHGIRKGGDLATAIDVIKDFKKAEQTGDLPRLNLVHLPCDHTLGTSPGRPTPRAMVAENDLALGEILEAVSHSKFWKECAFFIVEDDAQDGPDHVDAHRTCAFVAGPYVRRGIVDSTMYDQCSMLRTIELILGLPPLSQFDAAATPMFACFCDQPDFTPYTCVSATWDLEETNTASAYGAQVSAKMDFDEVDRIDFQTLNKILWYSIKGTDVPMPAPILHRAGLQAVSLADDDDDD